MELLACHAREWNLQLTAGQLRAFQLYYQELIAWNSRFNLTAITDRERVQVEHFLDSLSCVLADPQLPTLLSSPIRVMDVGSGAGFPGLPLKIVYPRVRLTLLEATSKRTTFLEHIVGCLKLRKVEVVKGRAEEVARLPEHREQYDLVLSRAVARLAVLVEYMVPFCRVGGMCVAQKGAEVQGEVKDADHAIAVLGGQMRGIEMVELPGLRNPRSLLTIEKVSPTPERYPRRPGVPARRPLRGG